MFKQYATKEKREELANKSFLLTGRRSYYQKLMRREMLSIEEVDKVLNQMLERALKRGVE